MDSDFRQLSDLHRISQVKPHFWALSLKCTYQHVSECTESLLSKADRNHLVASRTPFFHKCCPCSAACLGIQIQHTEITARPVIICLSAAEWHELLTFYFRDLAGVFSSKEAREKQKWFCGFFCPVGANPLFYSAFVFSRGRQSSAFTVIIESLSPIQRLHKAQTSMQELTALHYLQMENIALIVQRPGKS